MKRLLLVLLLLAAPAAAAAQASVNIGERFCTLAGEGGRAPQDALAWRDLFDCGDDRLRKATDHLWLVADIGDLTADMAEPQIALRLSRQDAITFHAVYGDGDVFTAEYDRGEISGLLMAPGGFTLGAPRRESPIETVLIGVDQPWDPLNWADVKLVEAAAADAAHNRDAIMAALVTGLFCAPMLINLVFFWALRRLFVLYHLVTTACIVTYIFHWSGLVFILFPEVDVVTRSIVDHLTLGLAAFAACLLVRDICEKGSLDRRWRHALTVAGAAPAACAVAAMALAPRFPLHASTIYHALFILPIIVIIAALVRASLNGSTIARLQLLGWSGVLPYVSGRVLSGVGILSDQTALNAIFFPALIMETVATTCAVAYRVVQVRRERDAAVSEGHQLRRIAETDDLTGLPNRRAFHDRFEAYLNQPERRREAAALLLIDIDHFKRVNDTFGHDAGDLVLRQIALILEKTQRGKDYWARYGGEEFAALVTAPGRAEVAACAERLRRHIAHFEFGDADHPVGRVTASIGVAYLTGDAGQSYADYYGLADRALYDAKRAGRNQVAVAEDAAARSAAKVAEDLLNRAQA